MMQTICTLAIGSPLEKKTAKQQKTIDTFALAAGYAGMTTDNADGLVVTNNAATQLRGAATYSGNAAGIYVLKTGTVGDEDIYNGEFTATAKLTAQFGELKTGTIAAIDQYRIHGIISGFRPTQGSHDLSGWSLSLNKADLGNPTGDPASRRANTQLPNYNGFAGLQSFTGTTSGDGANGQWHGKFYGGDGEGLDTGADIPAGYTAIDTPGQDLSANQARFDDHPLAVVGEFNGHFTNGHVAGAFGAEKD